MQTAISRGKKCCFFTREKLEDLCISSFLKNLWNIFAAWTLPLLRHENVKYCLWVIYRVTGYIIVLFVPKIIQLKQRRKALWKMLQLVTERPYQQTGIPSPEIKMLLYYYITHHISIHQKKLQLQNQHTKNKITLITKCLVKKYRK